MKSRTFRKAAMLCLAALLGSAAFGQITTPKDLAGVRHLGPGLVGDTNATFAIGLSTNNGTTFVSTALSTDPHTVVGIVRPEADHVNKTADIFIVDRVNGVFMMRNSAGTFLPWNGKVAELVPFVDDTVLSSNHNVDYFNGTLATGEHRLFIGYQPADGVLRYTNIANIVTVSEKSAKDLAMDTFAATVSNQVVPLCTVCHISGGAADGLANHKFVPTSDPSHLALNFAVFEALVKSPGRAAILRKVLGQDNHVGGAQLTSGQQEYQNLDAFLQMLEKL